MKDRSLNQSDENKEQTGSQNTREPVFLQVGFIRKTHGIRGGVLMDITTDFPERLVRGKKVYLGLEHKPAHLNRVREAHRRLIISIIGYSNPESAAVLCNQPVFVRADEIPALAEGEYYHHDLIGLRVENEKGEEVGVLKSIIDTGANEVYAIEPAAGGEILIPAVSEYILSVDLAGGVVTIRELDWL